MALEMSDNVCKGNAPERGNADSKSARSPLAVSDTERVSHARVLTAHDDRLCGDESLSPLGVEQTCSPERLGFARSHRW